MIKIHNDGKEKRQSFEAYITDPLYVVGYGADENEAIENLKSNMQHTIKQLQDMDYEPRQYVDWAGEPVKK